MTAQRTCLLVSNFNIDVLKAALEASTGEPKIRAHIAPYDNVVATLINGASPVWTDGLDAVVVWTQPESISEGFRKRINFELVDMKQILDEVDAFASLLRNCSHRARLVLVPTWQGPAYHRGYGILDLRKHVGLTRALVEMNCRLAQQLDSAANVYVLDSSRWMVQEGSHAFSSKLQYMAKVPFGNAVFKAAAQDVGTALMAAFGAARKLLVLDLDDTLWGGVVGDVGWEELVLGGHDPVGEALVAFQKAVKSLRNRGVLLGIVSKNQEEIALEAIEVHPEMVLRRTDFAGWRINWNDKAQNIVELADELKLGLQSVVFFDDNPVERARVCDTLPEVLVVDVPNDKMAYRDVLMGLRCFDSAQMSAEDYARADMYAEEQERRVLRRKFGSLDEWLKSLDMKVHVEQLSPANLKRTTQLLNKTNQMNLSTRRLTEPELLQWARAPDHQLWTFRVEDKFGDSGLTGILSLEIIDHTARIVDFVLSCRVMGRRVEETMQSVAVECAKARKLNRVLATYQPTKKNCPCLEFWTKSPFSLNPDGNTFSFDVSEPFPEPECVTITFGKKGHGL